MSNLQVQCQNATDEDLVVWLRGPNSITVHEAALNLDWTDSAARVGPLFAGYVLNGVIYACWQSVVQFVIATLANDPKLTARYAGLFKSAVSAGMTVSFGVTAGNTEFLPQLIWQFTQQMISLAFLLFICLFITETNYFQEKDVVVPTYVDEILHGRVDVDALKTHGYNTIGNEKFASSDEKPSRGGGNVKTAEC